MPSRASESLVNTYWDIILCIRLDEKVFFYPCWDTVWVLVAMGWVCSSQVEMHFVFSLAWEGFGLHMLRYIFWPRWDGRVCSNPHILYIHRHARGLVKASWDIFLVLAGMGRVWLTDVEINFLSRLAWIGFDQACWDEFCVLAFLEGVWPTHVINFVSSLAWEGFGLHKLSYILFPVWHVICSDNTSLETLCFLAGMKGLTQV